MWGRKHTRAEATLLVALLVLALAAPPVAAWQNPAHRLIIARAGETLPYPLRTFFNHHRFTLARLCNDPSQWGENATPRPEHSFIHLDYYGRYPFAELSRDYNDAVRKFGQEALNEHGVLPWQIGAYSLRLEEAFRNQQWDEVKLYAAIVARYVAEANDPFNTTLNFNGELSNQLGVDLRYTSSLIERYQGFFFIRPHGYFKIEDPTAHAFGMVIESHTWVDNILLADSQARGGKVDYSDDYYDDFYEGAGPILIRQLTSASQNVASYWYTAWVNAGSPTPPAD